MRRRLVLMFGVLLLVLSPCVAAQETLTLEEQYRQQLDASGADKLPEQLPKDVQDLLRRLELDTFDPESYTQLSFQSVINLLLELMGQNRTQVSQAFGMVLGVVLVSALFSGMEGTTLSPVLRKTYHSAAVVAAGGVLLVPLFNLLNTVGKAVEQVAVFLTAYVPVYAGLVASGGRVTSALSYQTTLLGASQVLFWLIKSGVFPLLTVSLAFGCTGSVAEGFCLDRMGQTIQKGILWGLGLFSTLFSFLLSFQQMASSAGDSLGGRVVRFSLTSFVPVVGNLLGEAYSTVVGCANLLRSAVGCFGLVSVVLVIAPPLLSCICWNIGLRVAADTAALFRLEPLERLCQVASGSVRVLIAVLAVLALLMMISSIVVAAVGG